MKYQITIEVDSAELEAARVAYPASFPRGGMEQWSESGFRRAIDVLNDGQHSGYKIVSFRAVQPVTQK